MKKQIIFSMVALIAVLVLVIVRITIGYDIEKKEILDDEYYNRRVKAEWKMQEKADGDALETFRQLKKNPEDRAQCVEEVTDCLQYALDHFAELDKGQEADIEITAKLCYAHSFITALYMHSDYDQTVHTAKEKRFWKCLVNRYIHLYRNYAINATSNHQEKAELLEIEALARKLLPNLDEEAAVFVNRLADVMEESSN